jgi:hypothetical protein
MKTKETELKNRIKNYPFLLKLRKDNWVVDGNNKHILIASYQEGKAEAKLEFEKIISKIDYMGFVPARNNFTNKELNLQIVDFIKSKLKEQK